MLKLKDDENVTERVERYVENPNKGPVSTNEDVSQSVIESNGINQKISDERLNSQREVSPELLSNEGIVKTSSSAKRTPILVKVPTYEDPFIR